MFPFPETAVGFTPKSDAWSKTLAEYLTAEHEFHSARVPCSRHARMEFREPSDQTKHLAIHVPGLSGSPLLDDGYSSLSSLSTLNHLTREHESFRSTPVLKERAHQVDSGLDDSLLSGDVARRSLIDSRPLDLNHTAWSGIMNQSDEYPVGAPRCSWQTRLNSPLEPLRLASLSQPFSSLPFDFGINHPNMPSASTPYCSRLARPDVQYHQVLTKVRQEMISLIDNSVKHLESILKHSALARSLHENSSATQEVDNLPLNLKAPAHPKSPPKLDETKMVTNGKEVRVTPRKKSPLLKPTCGTVPSIHQLSPCKKLSGCKQRRRLRVRTTGRRLRVRRTLSKHREQVDLEESAEADGTLDLRVHRGLAEHDDCYGDYRPNAEVARVSTTSFTLTAVHLKRAKLMFMYARYPCSNLLKSFFDDVSFTRQTTAQLVKWFSNFREFFYIQIERTARQLVSEGGVPNLTCNHPLVRILQLHYNRDNDIETPPEFLHTTQVALGEFAHAISNRLDRDCTWKKTIYKTVSLLDRPFPNFLRFVR